MAGKRKKRKTGKSRIIRSRDPFWRLRRVLGSSRVESRKAYKRPAARASARRQIDDA